MLLKCYTQYVSRFGKLSSGHRTGKGQFSFQSQRRAMPKIVQTTAQWHSFHMLAPLCSKSFKLGFNSTRIKNFHMYNLDLEKAGGLEIKLPKFIGSYRKQGNSSKTSTTASLTTKKLLTVWITTNCRKFLKRWEHQTTLPASWETCMQVKKQQLEPDMEQWTSSKLGKKYIKAIYFHPACLTYTQSTSCKMLGYMNYKLESDCQDKYQQPQIYWWCHSNGRKLRGTKQPLDKGEKGKWKNLA